VEATMTPPIEDEIRNRLAPPGDDFPPDVEEPQHLPEVDEEEPGPYIITLELVTTGLSDVEAVKKAHELLQSARSKGLELVEFNVSDFYLAQAADALAERVAERG